MIHSVINIFPDTFPYRDLARHSLINMELFSNEPKWHRHAIFQANANQLIRLGIKEPKMGSLVIAESFLKLLVLKALWRNLRRETRQRRIWHSTGRLHFVSDLGMFVHEYIPEFWMIYVTKFLLSIFCWIHEWMVHFYPF